MHALIEAFEKQKLMSDGPYTTIEKCIVQRRVPSLVTGLVYKDELLDLNRTYGAVRSVAGSTFPGLVNTKVVIPERKIARRVGDLETMAVQQALALLENPLGLVGKTTYVGHRTYEGYQVLPKAQQIQIYQAQRGI